MVRAPALELDEADAEADGPEDEPDLLELALELPVTAAAMVLAVVVTDEAEVVMEVELVLLEALPTARLPLEIVE